MPQMPSSADDQEPHRHDRPERPADPRGAARLHREQRDQDHHRDRQDVGVKAGVAMSSPSSADSTEIAGVIAPSP